MKKSPFILSVLIAATLGMSSCAPQMADYYSSPAFAVGSIARVLPGTVVSAQPTVIQADPNAVAAATVAGAAAGAGSGSLLGGGRARAVSTVGFGLLGAGIGNVVAQSAGRRPGQVLSIKSDASGKIYAVTQPIFMQFGEIPAGTHGNLRISNGVSVFAPDGY